MAKLGLVAAVALLGLTVLYLGAGGLGSVVAGISASLGGFITSITAAPTPKPSVAAISDPPSLQQPAEPYTAEATVDLVVTVPSAVAGDPNSRIRVYLALKDQAPDADPGGAARVDAADGHPRRAHQGDQRLLGHDRRARRRVRSVAVVRYVLDQAAAKITIYSPEEGAVVNGRDGRDQRQDAGSSHAPRPECRQWRIDQRQRPEPTACLR